MKPSDAKPSICLTTVFILIVGWGLQVQGTSHSGPSDSTSLHQTLEGFRNTNPEFTLPNVWTRTKFIISRIWTTTVSPRTLPLPVHHDRISLNNSPHVPTVTWVGHSTLLIQLDGLNILTDPQWANRASPVSFAGPKRVSLPGIRLEDLPPIHLVVISHNHYDHLDADTIDHLTATHHPLFLVPLGLKEWFTKMDITHVEELDWWENHTIENLTVFCLPAQHFSGRTFWDRNETLWSSWAIIGQTHRFFFSGDTGYFSVFKKIGDRFGPFDLAAVSIGAYRPREIMRMTHLTPEEALQVFSDLQGKQFLGIHWGTFDLTEEPFDEPPTRLHAEAQRRGLDPEAIWVLNPGETRQW